ncbi:CLUMA_CG011543, isoform A [Clunio marinus]|uniref:CLUMA_CG011543, isoform A n=1 Tax=Clunio marinus TaxID=568069 RepID=A0A1J1IEI0_9DIPT|nr:CLUMA_CG011543, isoform A [Clunio marinus]
MDPKVLCLHKKLEVDLAECVNPEQNHPADKKFLNLTTRLRNCRMEDMTLKLKPSLRNFSCRHSALS